MTFLGETIRIFGSISVFAFALICTVGLTIEAVVEGTEGIDDSWAADVQTVAVLFILALLWWP